MSINRFMPRSDVRSLGVRSLGEMNAKLSLRTCANCCQGSHAKCTGRRRLRLERRWAPCECAVCNSKKKEEVAQ
jgi:hypothetical protein